MKDIAPDLAAVKVYRHRRSSWIYNRDFLSLESVNGDPNITTIKEVTADDIQFITELHAFSTFAEARAYVRGCESAGQDDIALEYMRISPALSVVLQEWTKAPGGGEGIERIDHRHD